MADLVKIRLLSTEYEARFERPTIAFIGSDRQRAIEGIVDALVPFGFRLANSEVVSVGPLSDHKVTFRFPDRGISLHFGAEIFQFTKEGSSWKTSTQDVQVMFAAEHALLNGTSARVGTCVVTVAMHAQLLTKSREETLARFMPAPFREWRDATSYGNHLKWATGDLLLDFSAIYQDGIFIRFSSRFEGHPSTHEMLEHVRGDEASVFALLGIEEDDDE